MENEESSLARLSLRFGIDPEEILARLLSANEALYIKPPSERVVLAVKKNYFYNLRRGESVKKSIHQGLFPSFISDQMLARVLPKVRYLRVPTKTLKQIATSKRDEVCDSFIEGLEIVDSAFESIDAEFIGNHPGADCLNRYPIFVEYCLPEISSLPVRKKLEFPHSLIEENSVKKFSAGLQDLHTDPRRIEEILKIINPTEKLWKSQQLIDLQRVFHTTWTEKTLSAEQVRQWEETMDTALSKENDILRESKHQRAFCIKSVRPKDFDRILKKTPKSGVLKVRGEGEIGRMYDSICRIARKLYDDGSTNAKLPKQEIVKKILAIEKMPLATANKVATLIKIDAKPSPRTGRPPKRK